MNLVLATGLKEGSDDRIGHHCRAKGYAEKYTVERRPAPSSVSPFCPSDAPSTNRKLNSRKAGNNLLIKDYAICKSAWISRFLISLPFIFLGSMVLFGLLGAFLKGGFWNVALTWGIRLGGLLSIVMFVSMNKCGNKKEVPQNKDLIYYKKTLSMRIKVSFTIIINSNKENKYYG